MVLEESNLDMSNRADHRSLGTTTRILMTEEKDENNIKILPIVPKPIEMEHKIVPEHPYCTNWPTNKSRDMESLKQREQRKGYAEAKAAEDRLRDIRGGQ